MVDLALGPGTMQHVEQGNNRAAWGADQDVCHEPRAARLLAVRAHHDLAFSACK